MLDDEPIVGGLFLSQLDWLCHPTRIDNTMRLLWLVNLWARARERLYYADRQGLYQVKQAILSHAYRAGVIEPIAYVDGTGLAFQELTLDIAPSIAAETLRDQLLELFWVPDIAKPSCPLCGERQLDVGEERLAHWQLAHANQPYLKLSWAAWIFGLDKSGAKGRLPDSDYRDEEANVRYWHVDKIAWAVRTHAIDGHKLAEKVDAEGLRALRLYQAIIGRPITSKADIEQLSIPQAEAYIAAQLRLLQIQAMTSRQPISTDALQALFLYPSDLLEHTLDRWDDLDDADLRKLDPEGLSLVGFRYASEQVQMVFLMPYRIAAGFLEPDVLEALRRTPAEVREEGQFYGRTVTEDERQQYPIEELLMDLGVDIDEVCPKGLVDRQAKQSERYQDYLAYDYDDSLVYMYDDEPDESDDEAWHAEQAPEWPKPDWVKACPICSAEIHPPHLRLQHWLEEHSTYTVLTSGQAAWVLDQNAYGIKSHYPCDFTAHVNNNPTRLWLLSTLEQIYQQLSLE